MHPFVYLLGLLLFFAGCSTRKAPPPSPPKYTAKHYTLQDAPKSYHTLPYQLQHETPLTLALYEQYAKWHSTPYKYGGNSKNGIDCSALVQKIYKDAFGLELPRTTQKQMKMGRFAKRSFLRPGDILFFKTSFRELHSGVYLENGFFIHASSSHGVTVSSIHNPYWNQNYYQARRILPDNSF